MEKKLLLFVAFVVALTLAGTTNAGVKQGDKELDIYGSYNTFNAVGGGSLDTTTVAGTLGYFVSDELEIGLVGSWSDLSVDGLGLTMWGIGGNLKYHFGTQNTVVPYAGGQFLYEKLEAEASGSWSGGGSVDGYLYGPLAGLKFFTSDRTFLFLEYQYQLYGGDIGDGIDDGHGVYVGISFLF